MGPLGKPLGLLLVFLLLAQFTQAQVMLRGKVIDKDTREPLPFVSIGVSGTSLGTASNENGEFTLNVPTLPRTLVFSELSHKRDTLRVTSAAEPLAVELASATITLPEVKVGSYAFQLVDRAYRRLQKDYAKKFYGKAFYRQITRIGGEPTELQEVIWNVVSNNSRIGGTAIAQGRYAGKKALLNFSNFSMYTRTSGLINPYDDSTKSLALFSPNTFKNYLLEIKGIVAGADTTKGGVAEISFETRPELTKYRSEGTVWIDTDTYQVLRYLITIPSYTDAAGNPNFKYRNPQRQIEMAFQPAADDSSPAPLSYIKSSLDADLIGPDKKTTKLHVQSFTFFYDTTPTRTNIAYEPPTIDNRDLDAIRSIKYDPEFWANNPVVKRTPVEDEVIAAFEKKGAFGTMVKK